MEPGDPQEEKDGRGRVGDSGHWIKEGCGLGI